MLTLDDLQFQIEMPLYYACLEDGNITKQQLEKMIKACAYCVLIPQGANVDGISSTIERLVNKMMKDEDFLNEMSSVLNKSLNGRKIRLPQQKKGTSLNFRGMI